MTRIKIYVHRFWAGSVFDSMTTTEFLQTMLRDVDSIKTSVSNDFNHIPTEKLNQKRLPVSWSALECFEHLNRYNAYYIQTIERAIANSQQSTAKELRSTWIGRKSIQMMHPSNKKKQKTFKRMNPSASQVSRDVIDQFLTDQERLSALLSQDISGKLNAKAVPVEFFKLLKMTIAEAIKFVIIHQQRHLLQARATLQS